MKALIIGGGIAGTVTAMALQKAGVEAVVCEAYGRSAEGVGAYLTLAVNGLRALASIDIDASMLRGGFDTPKMALVLGDGTKLTDLDVARAEDGTTSRTIKRADLYGALRDEAMRRGIVIEYGKRLVDVTTSAAGVVARFEDGTSAEGDLLIGADGLKSRVRTLIDPEAPRARYVGLLNAGGYARGVEADAEPGTLKLVFGKRGFFGYVRHPNGEIWWFANPARAKEPTAAELAAITEPGWREELLALFADDAGPACEIIRATPEIFSGWPTYDFPKVPVWHRDRMILIGDAAHAASPSSGQGASMAIEDAVTLAQCLRDEGTIEDAFRTYESLRRDRVERVVKAGKRAGDGKSPGPVGRFFRDFALRLIFSRTKRLEDPMRFVFENPIVWDTNVRAERSERDR
jgi:FAD-dependent urate hydroxylase